MGFTVREQFEQFVPPWKDRTKMKKVTPQQLNKIETMRFKRKGDLASFAASHPGALSAFFLAGVYAYVHKGMITKSSQLRDLSLSSWAAQFTGLAEVRDLQEIMTIAAAIDRVNRREISQALDILCQRVLAIQCAKRRGSSCEKAETLELIPGAGSSLASGSMDALTA